jgi:hypothetical protein
MAGIDHQGVHLPAVGIRAKRTNPATQRLLIQGREAKPLRVVAQGLDLGFGFARSLKPRRQMGECRPQHARGSCALLVRKRGKVAHDEVPSWLNGQRVIPGQLNIGRR